MLVSRIPVSIALVLMLVTTVGAAQNSQRIPRMRVEVGLQPIDVQVKDAKGNTHFQESGR